MWTELLKTSLNFVTKNEKLILWMTIEILIKLTIRNYALDTVQLCCQILSYLSILKGNVVQHLVA